MAFAASKSKRHLRKTKEGLSLTSMMDMMTIILLFLLKSMSTSGALIQPSPFLELPSAKRDMQPKKALSLLVTPDGVFEDVEANSGAGSAQPKLIADIAEIESDDNAMLPSLEKFLEAQRAFSDRLGQPFTGNVTIQCDKGTHYKWLLKVINTCGQTEYSTLDFVVNKK